MCGADTEKMMMETLMYNLVIEMYKHHEGTRKESVSNSLI